MREVSTFELANVSGGTSGVVEAAFVLGTIAATVMLIDALTNPYYQSSGYYNAVVYTPYPSYGYSYDVIIYDTYYYY